MQETVSIWEEKVIIPTYEVKEADKNPMFIEKRVYQGSSGKVYPYPMIESISDEKTDKVYHAVYLENKYLKVMILPELGGRIQRAFDKTNNYDFVYYNKVIKPALVGLAGPWISGGIEFNWPQHHRPTTFMPVDYQLQENEDGSKTLLVNDVDQMYGTKGIMAFTLYPDTAYIEIKGQLYNRTPFAQTFLWWANPAVAVHEETQTIFPPDVRAVMDHGKRDVSRFPIATGVYYKKDYSAGVDISRYKNIPVPTSFMAEKSDYDFLGGYDYRAQAGLLHVADHHVSPGKKQWTWGCGDFGKAWDRNLTDEDGPYIELMAGVYTDNQPDFTWLKPFEEKSFKQYFMPYKKLGAVKNASIHAVLNVELSEGEIKLLVYGTKEYAQAEISVYHKNTQIFETTTTISPEAVFQTSIVAHVEKESDLSIFVRANKQLLVSYEPKEKTLEKMPEPAQAAKQPGEIMSNEELYLTGLHLEQYRHATYRPDDYYLEGLKRDAGDIRINTAYGLLLLRRGLFGEAEGFFRKAIARLTWKNPNPYDSEAYYLLGVSLFYQERDNEAYDAFYKACWSNEQQEMGYYYLAVLDCRKKDFSHALEMIDKALTKNTQNIKARALKACILRSLSRFEEALSWILKNKKVDAFDYVSRFEELYCMQEAESHKHEGAEDQDERNLMINKRSIRKQELTKLLRDFVGNYIQVARDYAEAGLYVEALSVLDLCKKEEPLLFYYRAYYEGKCDLSEAQQNTLAKAKSIAPDYCFPNKLEDQIVLDDALHINETDAKAPYYLGNLYYDKQQYEKATLAWEKSVQLDQTFPTVYRNLALAYYNHSKNKAAAKEALEMAFALDKSDARIFLELDQLYKKLAKSPKERAAFYDAHANVYQRRDDLVIEYITLLNQLKRHEEALAILKTRTFHPWEGGEGKGSTQYHIALVELAKEKIRQNDYEEAHKLLADALIFPENLGEGKLEGAKDNDIYYYLGCCMENLNQPKQATAYFELATVGDAEPAGMMYYNDQPADMILYQGMAYVKLHKQPEANTRFYKLIDYGQKHLFDEMKIEYFAVSLPDFLIFEDDLNIQNKIHCNYLMGLGYLGLGQHRVAKSYFEKALALDAHHFNCTRYSSCLID